jgi:hypothetical protein
MNFTKLLTEIKNVPFITDNLKRLEVTDVDGNSILTLPRYGVWMVGTGGEYDVVDTGDDLPKLMKQYNIDKNHIFKLGEK